MKKLFLILSFALTAATSWAAKAHPGPIAVTQIDGTQLTVFCYGDEDFHWFTTTDGVLLVQEGTAFYIAEIDENGLMTATRQLAHNASERTEAEQQLVAAQAPRRAAFFRDAPRQKQRAMLQRIPIGTTTPAYFPHTGEPRALVILVQFSDVKFSVTDPMKSFNDYLNHEGHANIPDRGLSERDNSGSVRQYFMDMSDGLYKPQFDIVGPVTLSKTSAYYGKDSGASNKDVNLNEMIRSACQAIDGNVDFKQYDSNGDGYVDLVYIIYAGYAQSITGNSDDCIWPKSGTTGGGTYDGVTVSRYGVNNELNQDPSKTKRINGIGLFCHEFSHTLGLPDLYPNDGETGRMVNNQTMEFWDLMDSGTYTNGGYTPTPYSPWELETMGWVEIEELTSPGHITLPRNKYYRIKSDTNNEYLILQNFQNKSWGSGLNSVTSGCHGLLVHRIDYSNSNGTPRTAVNLGDYPNNTAGKPGVTLVPADGQLINYYLIDKPYTFEEYKTSHAGDPYPGTSNVTQLLSVKMNRCTIEKPIYNIKETDGVITFDYLKVSAIDNVSIDDEHGKNPFVYDLQGRKMPSSMELNKGIYIKNGKKFVVK